MKNKIFALLFCSVICALLLFGACVSQKPTAALHSKTDIGYIARSETQADISISSPQAFVYDVSVDQFIYIKGEDRILYPASTTKLLTALLALEALSPDTVITPGDELSLLGENSTIAYIKSHHILSVEMLIEGMLIPSGNDAAYALSAAAGKVLSDSPDISGTDAVELFIREMNTRAETLGLCGSSFTSPDGYFDENHYSTLEDMAIIAKAAYENKIIMKYAGIFRDDVVYASGHTNTWTNTNFCLDPDSEYYNENIIGLKTGSAGKGNYSLIAVYSAEEGDYIIGLFSGNNENDRFEDIGRIIPVIEKINNQ